MLFGECQKGILFVHALSMFTVSCVHVCVCVRVYVCDGNGGRMHALQDVL